MFTSKEDILREVHHQSNLGNTFATINWTQSKRKIAGDSESSSRQPTEYLVTMWHCDTVTVCQCDTSNVWSIPTLPEHNAQWAGQWVPPWLLLVKCLPTFISSASSLTPCYVMLLHRQVEQARQPLLSSFYLIWVSWEQSSIYMVALISWLISIDMENAK